VGSFALFGSLKSRMAVKAGLVPTTWETIFVTPLPLRRPKRQPHWVTEVGVVVLAVARDFECNQETPRHPVAILGHDRRSARLERVGLVPLSSSSPGPCSTLQGRLEGRRVPHAAPPEQPGPRDQAVARVNSAAITPRLVARSGTGLERCMLDLRSVATRVGSAHARTRFEP
jgi:hypothetical protein